MVAAAAVWGHFLRYVRQTVVLTDPDIATGTVAPHTGSRDEAKDVLPARTRSGSVCHHGTTVLCDVFCPPERVGGSPGSRARGACVTPDAARIRRACDPRRSVRIGDYQSWLMPSIDGMLRVSVVVSGVCDVRTRWQSELRGGIPTAVSVRVGIRSDKVCKQRKNIKCMYLHNTVPVSGL